MRPGLRKLSATAHITVSVGWLGAVAAFLALSIIGLTSRDAATIRGAYLSMNVIGLVVIVPLALAALATGVIEGLASQWGLVRYYWVAVKFMLTVIATGLLILHQFTAVASAAVRVIGPTAGVLPTAGRLGTQLVVDASLGIVVLLVMTGLSVYKPRRVGRLTYLSIVGGIVVLIVVMHLTGLAGHHS